VIINALTIIPIALIILVPLAIRWIQRDAKW
jgi:hypothetical protein